VELIVENLSCVRGGMRMLEGVSFALRPGGILLLRGPNGIGKTTLIRTILGLQPALSGTISPRPGRMAYAAHLDGVKTTLTVYENLSFWAKIHGADEPRDALAAFGLSDLANRRAQYLSAGQKRRLSLARLLLTGHKIWALDEPASALDPAGVELLADALKRHLADGGMALVATHVGLGLRAETLDLTQFLAVGRGENIS